MGAADAIGCGYCCAAKAGAACCAVGCTDGATRCACAALNGPPSGGDCADATYAGTSGCGAALASDASSGFAVAAALALAVMKCHMPWRGRASAGGSDAAAATCLVTAWVAATSPAVEARSAQRYPTTIAIAKSPLWSHPQV